MPVMQRKSGVAWSLLKCTNPSCDMVPLNDVSYLQNKLTLAIRTHIKKYYEVREAEFCKRYFGR